MFIKKLAVGAALLASVGVGALVGAGPAAASTPAAPQLASPCYSYGPPPNFFMSTQYFGYEQCDQCRSDAAFWALEGYKTWCWRLSAYYTELHLALR